MNILFSLYRGTTTSSYGLIVTFMMLMLLSCNDKYANLLKDDYSPQSNIFQGKNNKVLLVTIDGLNGVALTEIGDSNIPTLTAMKRRSLFSYRSLADFSNGDITYDIAYANLFTGVNRNKHNFLNEDEENHKLAEYPSIISRLNDKKLSTVVFGSNQEVMTSFASDAILSEYSENDDVTVSKAKNFLMKENASLVIVNLNQTEKIGKESSYSVSSLDYKDAVRQVDSYVEELKSTLESRKEYSNENWLIIVTSTLGAKGTSLEGGTIAYNNLSRNTFTMFYNKNFASTPISPNTSLVPFTSQSPVYNGSLADNNVAAIPNDAGLYNFGTDDLTIRFTMKGSGVERSWPVLLRKAGGIDTNEPGWRLYISGKNLSMQVAGNGGFTNWGSGLVVNDGEWHNVAVVFFKENNVRKVKIFVDGKKSGTVQDINGRGSLNTNEPLRIGRSGNDRADLPDVHVSHLQIYKGAWSDLDVINNSCRVEVDANSLHFNNLVGYWPSDEAEGNRLKNTAAAGLGKDLILQGKYSWQSFSDISELLCPKINDSFYKIVPNAVDVSTTIYTWLGIPTQVSWNLDGKVWPFIYNNIKP